MPQNISITLNVQVGGGPGFTVDRLLTVEAYDVINVTIPAGTAASPGPPAVAATSGTATVLVQPSASNKMQLLLITSNVYDARVTYSQSVAGATEVKLDAAQVLMGASLINLLGAAQQNLVLKNPLLQPITVTILVGRNAT